MFGRERGSEKVKVIPFREGSTVAKSDVHDRKTRKESGEGLEWD